MYFFGGGRGLLVGGKLGIEKTLVRPGSCSIVCHSSAIILVFIFEDNLADLSCTQLGVRGEQVDDIG